MLRPTKSANNTSHGSVGCEQMLQIAILCRALDMILSNCSPRAIEEHARELSSKELAPALPKVIESTINRTEETTLRLVTLRSVIRIMKSIEPVVDRSRARFVDVLCTLLNHSSTAVLSVEAALAIALFLDKQTSTVDSIVCAFSNDVCGRLMSILCTAATDDDVGDDCIMALAGLACRSDLLCAKIARRRACVLVLARSLCSSRPNIREISALGATAIFRCNNHIKGDLATPIIVSNACFLVQALLKAAKKESTTAVLSSILQACESFLCGVKVTSVDCELDVLELFFVVAMSEDYNGDFSKSAGLRFLKYVHHHMKDNLVVKKIVDLSTHPDTSVRKHALKLVHDVCFWNPKNATALLETTSLVDSMAVLIGHGSGSERLIALEIAQQYLFDEVHHEPLAQNEVFRNSLLGFASCHEKAPRRDKKGLYSTGVDVLVTLVTSQPHFFQDGGGTVLTWMIQTANSTSSEDLKARLVPAILALSQTLEQDECTSKR